MTIEASGEQTPITPLDLLRSLTDLETLNPLDVNSAINNLDVNGSPEALMDAEEVLGFAATGLMIHPEDEAWSSLVERATSVYQNRLALGGQQG